MKTCRRCGTEKPEEDFHRNKTRPGGRSYTCKACYSAWYKTYHQANAAKRRQNSAKWISENPDRLAAWRAANRKRYTPQLQARAAVNNAIRDKRFSPAEDFNCFDCGMPASQWDHYAGYAKAHWFDVDPVCRDCHDKRGASRRVANV